jgi:cytochrome d ubiquinol oxidase subunit I
VPHIIFGSLLAGGTVMAGLSAAQLRHRHRRGQDEINLFERSLRWGFTAFCVAIVPVAIFGSLQWGILQPAKFAAWDGDASALAAIQAEAVARFGPGDYLPPVGWVRGAALLMLGCWGVMAVAAVLGLATVLLRGKGWLYSRRWLHQLLMVLIPVPFLAVLSGWIFREVGRQPWIIHELVTTSSAVSHASVGDRFFSFTAFTGVFALLVLVNWWLIIRHTRRHPGSVSLGAHQPTEVSSWIS